MRTVYPAQQENLESQDYIEGPEGFRRKAQAELAEQVGGSDADPQSVLRRKRRIALA